MKRRLIYLSSLTLTVVVNLTLASAHGWGGRGWRRGTGGGKEETGEDMEGSVKSEDGCKCGRGEIRSELLSKISAVRDWQGDSLTNHGQPSLPFSSKSTRSPRHFFPPGFLSGGGGHIRPAGKWVVVVSGKPFGGLMDCSRRTIAAMFSDILMCEPCLALSEKREKFFLPLPNTLRYISRLILSAFQKIDDASECRIIWEEDEKKKKCHAKVRNSVTVAQIIS